MNAPLDFAPDEPSVGVALQGLDDGGENVANRSFVVRGDLSRREKGGGGGDNFGWYLCDEVIRLLRRGGRRQKRGGFSVPSAASRRRSGSEVR